MTATRVLLLALALGTAGVAFAPAASAAQCVVGSDPHECAASVQLIVCITEPCDNARVCLLYGKICRTV